MKKLCSLVLVLCAFILVGCGKKVKTETLTCNYNVGENSLTYKYIYKDDVLDEIIEIDELVLDVDEDEYDIYVDEVEDELKETYGNKNGIEYKITRYNNKKGIKFELKADPSKLSDEDKENSEIYNKTIEELKEYYEEQKLTCNIK